MEGTSRNVASRSSLQATPTSHIPIDGGGTTVSTHTASVLRRWWHHRLEGDSMWVWLSEISDALHSDRSPSTIPEPNLPELSEVFCDYRDGARFRRSDLTLLVQYGTTRSM